MKRKFFTATALLLCLGTVFSSCDSEANGDDDESSSENVITEESFDFSGNDVTENTPVDIPVNSDDETTTEETTEEPTEELVGTLIGYTSKNYPITVKDGITYIDGVLVANKTYSLPASYNPGDLLSECDEAFKEMQQAAASEGLTIWNASGFRSYELQESIYNRYCNRDGQAAADRYSARPGHSEHQTGLAIDLNEITSSFADTAEGKWVAENCWRYGFILRYMKGKEAQTGYMYEPWHIRYVGVEAAQDIYESGLCLEEYYGITSVYADIEELPEEETSTEETVTYEEELTASPENDTGIAD